MTTSISTRTRTILSSPWDVGGKARQSLETCAAHLARLFNFNSSMVYSHALARTISTFRKRAVLEKNFAYTTHEISLLSFVFDSMTLDAKHFPIAALSNISAAIIRPFVAGKTILHFLAFRAASLAMRRSAVVFAYPIMLRGISSPLSFPSNTFRFLLANADTIFRAEFLHYRWIGFDSLFANSAGSYYHSGSISY